MTNAAVYIKSINIEEVQEKSDKNGKPWWSVRDVDGEYYSTKDPMIVAQLAPGWKSVSIKDNQAGDKVFHNIVGIAPPQAVEGGEPMESFLPGAPTPAAPAAAAPAAAPTPAPAVAKPATPATPTIPNIYEVRTKALELAVAHCVGHSLPKKELATYRDAFYSYIVNGAPAVEQQNSSKEDVNEFIAQ